MKYLLPTILVAVVAFTGVTYGEPRVCYSCNSEFNNNCTLKAVNVSSIGIDDCEEVKSLGGGGETVCYKASGTVNGTDYIERGCALKKNSTGTDFCSELKELADQANTTNYLCDTCTKDFCNSSSLSMASFAVILLSFLLLLKI